MEHSVAVVSSTDPAVIVNVAFVAPDRTTTLAGILTAVVFEVVRSIDTPELGAAALSVTIAVVVCPEPMTASVTVRLCRAGSCIDDGELREWSG